jgi:hypothetical protein
VDKFLLEPILDFLVSTPTPEQIIAFASPEAIQARLDELLAQNRSGRLSEAERAELDALLFLNSIMSAPSR